MTVPEPPDTSSTDRAIAIGPIAEPFDDVSRIVVMRGGGIGDLLFIMPAVDALAVAYPEATISLLGMPIHEQLLRGRPSPITEVIELPIAEGVRAPSVGDVVGDDLDGWRDVVTECPVDLAVQLHGGGRYSNPFLLRLGARHTVGAATDDATRLERSLPYRYFQHEMLRALEVVGYAGARPVGLEAHIEVMDSDRAAAAPRLAELTGEVMIGMHPGASGPRRRWPAERFADVAARIILETEGDVVVVGDASDAGTTAQVVATTQSYLPNHLHPHVRDLGGRLSTEGLVGVLDRCDVVVGNDSGPIHLAQTVGAATVGMYWAGNIINAAPLGRARHRVHAGWTSACPICGRDVTQVGWTASRCDHDPSFVVDVMPGPVADDVLELLTDSAELT